MSPIGFICEENCVQEMLLTDNNEDYNMEDIWETAVTDTCFHFYNIKNCKIIIIYLHNDCILKIIILY